MSRLALQVLLALTTTLAGPEPGHSEQIWVGDEDAIIIKEGATETAIPLEAKVREISLTPTRDHGGAVGALRLRLMWSSTLFMSKVTNLSVERQTGGRPPLQNPGSHEAQIFVDLPAPGGSVEKLSRIVRLSPGREESIEFLLDAALAAEVGRVAVASRWSPTVAISIKRKDLSIPLRVEPAGEGLVLRRPDGERSRVTVYLPVAVTVPDATQIIYWTNGKQNEQSLFQGTTDLGNLPVGPIDFEVVQYFPQQQFRNAVCGRMTLLSDGSPLSERLPIGVTSIIVSPDQLEKLVTTARYLLFLFRDQSRMIRVAYVTLPDRTVPLRADILREDGVPLVDGLLLGFDGDSVPVDVHALSSSSFQQADVFLRLSARRAGPEAVPAAQVYLIESVGGRVRAALGVGEQSPIAAPEIAELISRTEGAYSNSGGVVAANARPQHFAEPIEALNGINDAWLEQHLPGARLAVQLKVLRDSDAIAAELRRAGPAMERQDAEGLAARTAVLGFFERAADGPAADLAHLLLAQSKAQLDRVYRERFWRRALTLVVPRDATLTEAVPLLASGREVKFSDGEASRPIGYNAGGVSLDLSGLGKPEALDHVRAVDARAIRIALEGSNLSPAGYSRLAELGPTTVELDLHESAIDTAGLSGALNQPTARSMILDLRKTAVRALVQENLNSLRRLDVDLFGATTELSDPFGRLNADKLRYLRINLSKTRWLAGVSLGTLGNLPDLEFLSLDFSGATLLSSGGLGGVSLLAAYPRLKTLSVALPKSAGAVWLSGGASNRSPVLDELVVLLDPGANADQIFSEIPTIAAKRVTLLLANTVISDATLDLLRGRLHAERLELNLRGTRIGQTKLKDFAASAALRGSVRIITPDGAVVGR